jgi:predicted Rossmann-fold nucleotide-binding protein
MSYLGRPTQDSTAARIAPSLSGSDTFTPAELSDLIGSILRGEKPLLDPDNSPRDAAFVALLDDMYAADDLDAPATKYFTDASWDADKVARRTMIDTRNHTVHIGALEEFRTVKNTLLDQEFRNFEVLGARSAFRQFGQTHVMGEPMRLIESAENFILTKRADLWACYQALQLMQDGEPSANRIFAKADNERVSRFLGLLGIDSRSKAVRYNNVLRAGGVSTELIYVRPEDDFLQSFQQYASYARQRPPVVMLQQQKREGSTYTLSPIIYFNTGNPEKVVVARESLRAGSIAAAVRSADELSRGVPHRSSDEYFETFSGNANDKHEKAMLSKLQFLQANPDLVDAMEKDARPVWLMSADEGAVFDDQDVFNTDAFRIAREESMVSEDGDAPGPETKPLSAVLGSRAAYIHALQQTRTGDFSAVDHCVIVLSQITPELIRSRDWNTATAADLPQASFIKSTCPLIYRLGDTGPDQDVGPTTELDYKVLNGCTKTQQVMLDSNDADERRAAHTKTAFGVGLPDAMALIGAQRCEDLRQEFANNAHALKIAVNPHLPDADYAIDMSVVPEGSAEIYKAAPITSLGDLKTMIEEADGYLHVPAGQDLTRDQLYLALLVSCGSFVGKQLGDSLVNGNPTGYINPDTDEAASTFIRMLQHKRVCGMVSERPDVFFFTVNDNKPDTDPANLMGQTFRRMVETYDKGSYKSQRPPSDKPQLPDLQGPSASIFLSASASRPDLLEDGYNLTYNLVTNGIGAISGGGDKNMMGASSYGGLVAKMYNNPEGYIGGIQDPYAMIREGAPDHELNAVAGPGYFTVAPDRYARMHNLFELDRLRALPEGERKKLLIIQPGGIGTDEELLAAVWLKSIGEPGLSEARIVIQNKPMQMADGSVVRPYDALIDLIGKDDMDRFNITVVETVEEIVKEAGTYFGVDVTYRQQRYHAGAMPFDPTQNGGYTYTFAPVSDRLFAAKGLLPAGGSHPKVAA